MDSWFFSEKLNIIFFKKKYPLYKAKYTQYIQAKSIHEAPLGLFSIILYSGNFCSIPNRSIVRNTPTIGEKIDLKGCFLFIKFSPYYNFHRLTYIICWRPLDAMVPLAVNLTISPTDNLFIR